MNAPRHRITHVELDAETLVHRRPEVEQERAVAIFDLVEANRFVWLGNPDTGPYRLFLTIDDGTLIFELRDDSEQPLSRIPLALAPFWGIARDYFLICESYFSAIRRAPPSQIDAINEGRQALLDEGAQLMKEQLAENAEVDDDTARRLFALLCVLHIRVA